MCRARGTVGATPKGLRIWGLLKGVLEYTWVALEASEASILFGCSRFRGQPPE